MGPDQIVVLVAAIAVAFVAGYIIRGRIERRRRRQTERATIIVSGHDERPRQP